MKYIAGEARKNLKGMFYGPLHMDVPVLVRQQELIFIGSVWTQDVVGKTYQEWWMIEMDGERELGKSVIASWLHDDYKTGK